MTGSVDKNAPKSDVRDSLRKRMPVSDKYAYFDHAAVGPISQPAADAIQKWTNQSLSSGDVFWPEWSATAGRLRTSAAKLLCCQSNEIALIPNTTFGINMIAQGYRWLGSQCAESVVVLSNEFSSNLLPWLALEGRGVEVRRVSRWDSRGHRGCRPSRRIAGVSTAARWSIQESPLRATCSFAEPLPTSFWMRLSC